MPTTKSTKIKLTIISKLRDGAEIQRFSDEYTMLEHMEGKWFDDAIAKLSQGQYNTIPLGLIETFVKTDIDPKAQNEFLLALQNVDLLPDNCPTPNFAPCFLNPRDPAFNTLTPITVEGKDYAMSYCEYTNSIIYTVVDKVWYEESREIDKKAVRESLHNAAILKFDDYTVSDFRVEHNPDCETTIVTSNEVYSFTTESLDNALRDIDGSWYIYCSTCEEHLQVTFLGLTTL